MVLSRLVSAATSVACVIALSTMLPAAAAAQDDAFHFVTAPKEGVFRIYRVNTKTGEVGLCWFSSTGEQDVGVTNCAQTGEGAGQQAQGDYRLVAAEQSGEPAVFRVNLNTGEVSICYISTQGVVCTPPG